MSYEAKDELILFPNERKHDKQPVMRGVVTLTPALIKSFAKAETPVELEVSLWGNVSAKGNKFWKGPIKPKQEREAKPIASEPPPFDDDLPF